MRWYQKLLHMLYGLLIGAAVWVLCLILIIISVESLSSERISDVVEPVIFSGAMTMLAATLISDRRKSLWTGMTMFITAIALTVVTEFALHGLVINQLG